MRNYRLVQLLTSRPGLTLMVVVVAFVATSFFVPARFMVEVGDAFSIPMCAAAFWVYGRTLMNRSSREPDYVDLLILGVCGGWLTNFLDRSLRLYSRMFDATLAQSRSLSFLLVMLTFFAGVHVLVRGSGAGEGMRHRYDEGWRTICCALAIGVVLAAVVLTFHALRED